MMTYAGGQHILSVKCQTVNIFGFESQNVAITLLQLLNPTTEEPKGHSSYVIESLWLCSSKTLFMDTENWLSYNSHVTK